MDAPTFRNDFPAFSDAARFPDATVNFWLNLGKQMLPADRWCNLLDYGLELFTAHHLAIGDMETKANAAGGVPGQIKGPETSKSVDKVSVSRDAASVTLTDGGFWNMTSYGVRFLQMARMVGAGGIQL